MDDVIPEISGMVTEEALSQLKCARDVLKAEGLSHNVRIDFSVVNEMGYYNGIMFDGFVKGISKPVIAGGRYDNLMKSMGKKCGAVGFSVSLDALERLGQTEKKNDVRNCVKTEKACWWKERHLIKSHMEGYWNSEMEGNK